MSELTVCLTAVFLNSSLVFMLKDHVNQATSSEKERNSNVTLRVNLKQAAALLLFSGFRLKL